MNLKQAEIILEKINRLYNTMKLDERNVDVFEQDLMLSYIRQLYDVFAPEQKVVSRNRPVLPKPESKVPPKPEPKPVAPKPKQETPPPPPPKPEPEPEKVVAPKPPKVPKVVQEGPPPAAKPAPPKPTPAPAISSTKGLSIEDQRELFDDAEATELSEKLSQLPIKDLTKAMGLNEKIFTINELFGGDNKAFNEALKTLNSFRNFEEARKYLSENIASRFDWTDKAKKKKARNFIRLVQRRYK